MTEPPRNSLKNCFISWDSKTPKIEIKHIVQSAVDIVSDKSKVHY